MRECGQGPQMRLLDGVWGYAVEHRENRGFISDEIRLRNAGED